MQKVYIITALVLALSACQKKNASVYEFRGPNRTGIFFEDNLLKSWPETGLEELFYIDSIGDGYAPPVIANNLLFVTGAVDSSAILYCYDLSGIKNWEINLGKEWIVQFPGSRSSPTIIEDLLYVGTGIGDLYCINIKDRNILWSKSLSNDFQGILPLHGFSESPVVHGNKVFWTPGGSKHNVVALNRFSGDILWSAEGVKERSGYNPPRIIKTPTGRTVFITYSAYNLMGFDAENGELLWTHQQDNLSEEQRKPGYGDTHANTVIYENGNIYYAAGDGNCGVKLSLSEDGTEIREVWRNRSFDSYMGGIIKLGDYIYGSGTASPKLYSIDAETGTLTDSLAIGRGTIIAADDMIYYYSQRGLMYLVSYNDGLLEEVSSFRIEKGTREHFSHPLIHEGILYIRHGNSIIGYDITEDA